MKLLVKFIINLLNIVICEFIAYEKQQMNRSTLNIV